MPPGRSGVSGALLLLGAKADETNVSLNGRAATIEMLRTFWFHGRFRRATAALIADALQVHFASSPQ
jgi:hypothetical protein